MENVSFHHIYFIYITSMIDDKVTWTSNCHYNDKKWPTYLPTYLATHLLTHSPTYPPCEPTY
jgi:hypothetical protein